MAPGGVVFVLVDRRLRGMPAGSLERISQTQCQARLADLFGYRPHVDMQRVVAGLGSAYRPVPQDGDVVEHGFESLVETGRIAFAGPRCMPEDIVDLETHVPSGPYVSC